MSSISHLKSPFFADNINCDKSKNPEYGIVPLEMEAGMSDLVLAEANKYGEEVEANTSMPTRS